MRKLRIEINVPEGPEADVRKSMVTKVEQLAEMIGSDGPEAFCWTGAANDAVGRMKFTVATPSKWVTTDEGHGLQKDGIYRHFKGNEYAIVGFGRDTETEEIMVIYRRHDQPGSPVWVRPAAMFAENVIIEGGREVARFQQVDVCVQSQFI